MEPRIEHRIEDKIVVCKTIIDNRRDICYNI